MAATQTDQVTVRLHDKEKLWSHFSRTQNEMIVTKTGRKMFPKLEFEITGMDPDQYYAIFLQIEQVDDHRYKFQDGEWSPAGRGEQLGTSIVVGHHDGVMLGSQWMRSPVHFERLKITNNPQDTNPSHVFLHSMHKYCPVITVYKTLPPVATPGSAFMPPLTTQQMEVARVRFPDTEFITVTAYQNDKTKALKIKYNPYAKGFREGRDRIKSSPRSSPSDGPPVESVKTSPLQLSPPSLLPMSPLNLSPINPLLYNTAALWNPYLWSNLSLQTTPYRLAPLPKPFSM